MNPRKTKKLRKRSLASILANPPSRKEMQERISTMSRRKAEAADRAYKADAAQIMALVRGMRQ